MNFRLKFPSRSNRFGVVVVAASFLAASCSGSSAESVSPTEVDKPDDLAFVDDTNQPAPSTTLAPVAMGTREKPFANLPSWDEPAALRTDSGVIVPVVGKADDGYKIRTPCDASASYRGGEPIGRAHVVLDPGHGGYEFGAVGPGGAVEKELNLTVAQKTKELLTEQGATVVLTRENDHAVTLATRAAISNQVKPALFVSIHHNGGAPAGGAKPGTIVFTKTDSPEATRFGGLFHDQLTPLLNAAAAEKTARWNEYEALRIAHEAEVDAYEQSVQAHNDAVARNQAIVAQAKAAATTTTPPTTVPADPAVPTTVPPTTAPPTTITLEPVPEILPVPAPFTVEPVQPFSWAGSGNAGVRSWTKPNGEDYLGVLRRADEIPSVLTEFLYVTNPAEEELLLDPAFIEAEARALADSIVRYFGTTDEGSGFVQDQTGDQDIGGGGAAEDCIEPDLDNPTS